MTAVHATQVDYAIEAAVLGPVFPLHSPDPRQPSQCTCLRRDCTSPAKHPRVENGFRAATRDHTQIRKWFHEWSDANVGLASGNGLFILDVDDQHGGGESLAALVAQVGDLPETATVLTGNGQHLYFSYSSDLQIGSKVGLRPGLDIRADGGYVVAVGSHHVNGRVYEWETGLSPEEVGIAPLPHWLRELIENSGSSRRATDTEGTIPEGSRNATLASLAGSMRRRGMSREAIEAALLVENERCDPPLPDLEVKAIAASVSRYAPSEPQASKQEGGLNSLNSLNSQSEWPETPDDAAFTGLAGEIVRAFQPYSEADPIAMLAQLVSAFGIAVGTGPHCRVGATRHELKVNVVVAGSSAKARKGESWTPMRLVMEQADSGFDLRIQSGLSTGEGLIHAVRDAVIKSEPQKEHGRVVGYEDVVLDEGVGDKRLLIVESEFARVLQAIQRQGNTLSAVVRDAYDKDKLSTLTRAAPQKATGAHIGIIAHITTEELTTTLYEREQANGLANRFLFVAAKRSQLLPNPPALDQALISRLAVKLHDVIEFAKGVGEIRRDDDANRLWENVYPELSAERSGLTGSLLARAEAITLRLSAIYALLDKSNVVCPAHLQSALELWGYAERSVLHIFGDQSGDPVADAIVSAFRRQPEMSRTELSAVLGRHVPAARLDAALQRLQSQGKVKVREEETGGRPREVWRWSS